MNSTNITTLATVGTPYICQTFPELAEPQVKREIFISTIDGLFKDGASLVFIEGTEEIGKTTLLAQFAMAHQLNVISLFVKSSSFIGGSTDLLLFDLCNQMNWLLNLEQLEPNQINPTFYRRLLIDLQKRGRQTSEIYYFVIDGLFDPQHHSRVVKQVLELLPLEYPNFRFLFTGREEQLRNAIPTKIKSEALRLLMFSIDETRQYFDGINIHQEGLHDIHKTCQGIPGRLASVRRILRSGTSSLEALLEALPARLPALYEIEWQKVNAEDDLLQVCLGILCFDDRKISLSMLSLITHNTVIDIRDRLANLTFVEIGDNGSVAFVTEPFRQFAFGRLQAMQQKVNTLLIAALLEDQDSEASLSLLPEYLQRAGRFQELLTFLSPKKFQLMLGHTGSTNFLKQKTASGIAAAQHLSHDGDLLRFGVQGSAIEELNAAKIWKSEIEARVALNDYDAALTLAKNTIIREDRLHLLAIIAKAKKLQGLAPDEELVTEIKALCDQVNFNPTSGQVFEIAAELIHSLPDLAIQLAEKRAPFKTEDGVDWVFALLSLSALQSADKHPQSVELSDNLRAKIKNPEALKFTSQISLLVRQYSAKEVVAESEKIDLPANQIFMLRQWTRANCRRPDAAIVVEYALTLVIRTTSYAPTASTFRELATPLPFVPDIEKLRQLIGILDNQKDTVERVGPTEEYVRLQLLLAEGEHRYNKELSLLRTLDTYYYIENIDDVPLKSECFARLISTMEKIDPDKTFEVETAIFSTSEQQLTACINCLLEKTADHFEAIVGVIKRIAKMKPNLAYQWAMMLNTEDRRDAALLEVVTVLAQQPHNDTDISSALRYADDIKDPFIKDTATLKMLERLTADEEDGNIVIEKLLPVIERAPKIADSYERSLACLMAINHLYSVGSGEYSDLISHLEKKLELAWEAVDVEWNKIDIGFHIAAQLAKNSIEFARRIVARTEEFRDSHYFGDKTTASTYLVCLRFVIRAYGGLVKNGLDTDNDLERLTDLIDTIASRGERAVLWSELAARSYAAKNLNLCKRIVTEKVKPNLASVPMLDFGYRCSVIMNVIPAMYVAHQNTALNQIAELPEVFQDDAYFRICQFLFRKLPANDPFEGVPGQAYDISYEEMIEICDLLNNLSCDSFIVSVIETLANCILSPLLRNRLSKNQKAELCNRIELVIHKKLPSPRFITHDGFKIIALAQLARIKQLNSQDWEALVGEARKIINPADRAFTLIEVAKAREKKADQQAKDLFAEAKELIGDIPTVLDQVDRYELLASMSKDVAPNFSKECLRLAMGAAVKGNTPGYFAAQKRIIDIAYRHSPDLANSLASMADTDPARGKRSIIRKRLDTLNYKKRVIDQVSSDSERKSHRAEDCPQAAWMLLGTLNADRMTPLHVDQTRDFVQVASNLPIHESYPIISWVIENNIRRSGDRLQAEARVRPLYEATLIGAEVARSLTTRSNQIQRFQAQKQTTSELKLIKNGQRDIGVEVIKTWFEEVVTDRLVICDSYFGVEDLEVLKLLQFSKPNCRVTILTSRKKPDRNNELQTAEEFRAYWHSISDQMPPETDIYLIGTQTSKMFPIHDRWWITTGGGLRLGTSYNSLGRTRDSEISSLSSAEADQITAQEFDPYTQRSRREHNGERLIYDVFSLWDAPAQ